MKSFQGTTLIKLDSSGRLKLPPNVVADFNSVDSTGKVVLKLLAEGTILILPASLMPLPSNEPTRAEEYLTNPAIRLRMRREMLSTAMNEISQQGRITLPENLLRRIHVQEGEEVALIGVGHGYEIWKKEALEEEMDKELEQEKRQYEKLRDQPEE